MRRRLPAIVATEIGDRLEIGDKPAHQPHRLDITPASSLQPPGRANLIDPKSGSLDGLNISLLHCFNRWVHQVGVMRRVGRLNWRPPRTPRMA
jgi:hypothetical protein